MALDYRSIQRFEILGVKFSAVNLAEACQAIDSAIQAQEKGYVSVCPVSTIMACVDDAKMRGIVNAAALVTPDGMPSVWIGRNRGFKNMGRVYGPDLMLAVCAMSQEKGYRNYFYGATPDVLDALARRLTRQFPRLQICGGYSPPFCGDAALREEDRIIAAINQAEPHILWVGLGSPKQDYWIDRHRRVLNAPMMLAVGAAFDFLSGTKPQAPRWMQRSGLEWFFRLCCEPRRLWKRYLIGNSRFVYLLVKDFMRVSAGKKTC